MDRNEIMELLRLRRHELSDEALADAVRGNLGATYLWTDYEDGQFQVVAIRSDGSLPSTAELTVEEMASAEWLDVAVSRLGTGAGL